MNGAFSAGISVENALQAWDAATCVDPFCYPVGFRTACEVNNLYVSVQTQIFRKNSLLD